MIQIQAVVIKLKFQMLHINSRAKRHFYCVVKIPRGWKTFDKCKTESTEVGEIPNNKWLLLWNQSSRTTPISGGSPCVTWAQTTWRWFMHFSKVSFAMPGRIQKHGINFISTSQKCDSYTFSLGPKRTFLCRGSLCASLGTTWISLWLVWVLWHAQPDVKPFMDVKAEQPSSLSCLGVDILDKNNNCNTSYRSIYHQDSWISSDTLKVAEAWITHF